MNDQEWMAQLPPEQQPEQPAAVEQPAQAPGNDYRGQVAEIYSGKNVYKLPYTAEIPFKQNGKVTTMPIGKVLNGYNQHLAVQPKYDSMLKEFNTIKPEYEMLKGKQDRFAQLEQLQDWSEKNPEIFKHVWDSYSNREKLAIQHKLGVTPGASPEATQQAIPQALIDELTSLKQELGPLKEFHTTWQQQQQEQANQKNVAQIESEITDFKKEFDFIDLDTPGDDGLNLQEKIIQFGLEQKFPNFTVSALSYLKPQLLERMKDQGRSEAVKGLKEQHKKGIVATSDTPFPISGQSPSPADAKKSDNVLLQEAKAMMEQVKHSS